MFGYVLPNRAKLAPEDLAAYQALYCGLCHSLKRRCGFAARFVLNYDFTFLAMVLADPTQTVETVHKRCVACPIKGKDLCPGGEHLDLCADESVILTWWKLRDSVRDEGFFKALAPRFLSLLLRPAYGRAKRARPAFDALVRSELDALHTLEEAKCESMDSVAHTFAALLQGAGGESADSVRRRTVGELLYHLGRWIYLVDAWDDLEKDQKEGTYNPLLYRFPDGPQNHADEARLALRHSKNRAIAAANLTDFGPWTPLVFNVLCLGLDGVEEAVFTGVWKEMKKYTRRNRHERPLSSPGSKS